MTTLAPVRPFGWRHLALIAGVWAALLFAFRDTAAVIVALWLGSDTYTHAVLVLPMVAWLVWRQRHVLAQQPVVPSPWLLCGVALAALAWLASELATVGVVAHFALATMLVLSVPAVVGWPVTRAMLFPLGFVYFAVPFGDAAVPLLMEWTADVTVFAIRLSGIPLYREGLQFVIPSGTWSVVQACSGVRYLIASFMVGTLFAYLNYRSLNKRLLFILAALIVPIVANWLRAYMIVMIGHLSSNELATGVDHLVYGWLFFGVVIGLMFFVGARWADTDREPVDAPPLAWNDVPSRSVVLTVLALAVLVVGIRAVHRDLLSGEDGPAPRLAIAGGGAWTADNGPPLPWTPGFPNASGTAEAGFTDGSRRVQVWIGYFRNQGQDRKMVSSMNGLVTAEDARWSQTSRGIAPGVGAAPAFRTGNLRRGSDLESANAQRLRVWQVYWVGGRWIASDVRAKAWQAVDRLLGRGDDGAVVLLVTPLADDADATLEKFARARLDAVGAALASARDTR